MALKPGKRVCCYLPGKRLSSTLFLMHSHFVISLSIFWFNSLMQVQNSGLIIMETQFLCSFVRYHALKAFYPFFVFHLFHRPFIVWFCPLFDFKCTDLLYILFLMWHILLDLRVSSSHLKFLWQGPCLDLILPFSLSLNTGVTVWGYGNSVLLDVAFCWYSILHLPNASSWSKAKNLEPLTAVSNTNTPFLED